MPRRNTNKKGNSPLLRHRPASNNDPRAHPKGLQEIKT